MKIDCNEFGNAKVYIIFTRIYDTGQEKLQISKVS